MKMLESQAEFLRLQEKNNRSLLVGLKQGAGLHQIGTHQAKFGAGKATVPHVCHPCTPSTLPSGSTSQCLLSWALTEDTAPEHHVNGPFCL